MNRTVIMVIVFVMVFVGGAYMLFPAYREHQSTHRELQAVRRQVLEQQRVNEDLRAEIFRLKTDDRTIERVARDKFNYARPNETNYDFSNPAGDPER